MASSRPALGMYLSALILALSTFEPAMAHEIGTTRVEISLSPSDEYVVALSVDAASLLGKLETLAGVTRSGPLDASQYKERIGAMQQMFLRRVEISFGDRAEQPVFDYVPENPPLGEFGAPGATIYLRGRVPSGARSVSWRYDLTYATYAVSVRAPGAASQTAWLEGQERRRFALDRPPGGARASVAATYLVLGFTHILPGGLDHILFVLGVFLFGRSVRAMLWQISAFTVAHSITLALTLYGVISLPSAVVEPMIALSIVYVAVENICRVTLTPWRVAVVFGFGLLHGMGFAGALRELGLPRSEFLTGLVTFNAGVEAGQLAIIGVASALIGHWSRNPLGYRKWIVVPGSALIALTGLYWTIVRLPMGLPPATSVH